MVQEITTNEQGEAKTILSYGTYKVTQTAGIRNHYFVENFTITVKEDDLHQNFPLYDIERTAHVKVKNVDSDSLLPILEPGANFKIKNLTTNEYVKDQNQDLLLVTNEQGITSSILLSSGYYQIEQASSVEGYVMNENVFPFEITDNNNPNEIEIVVPNDKVKSNIEIVRYTEYFLDNQLIYTEQNDNIKVKIFAKDHLYSKDGIKIYNKDEIVDTAYYKNGIVTTEKLVLGTYYIVSPINYKVIEIELTSSEPKMIELVDQKYEFTKDENPTDNKEPDNKPVEKPNEEPDEEPDNKPVETPNEKPDEELENKPVEKPNEKPDKELENKPVEKPDEEPDNKPVEKPDEVPDKEPNNKPVEKPNEEPDEKTENKPVEEPNEKPDEKKENMPVEIPEEKPEGEQKTDIPSIEVPKEESQPPIEIPVDKGEISLEQTPNDTIPNENLIIIVPNTYSSRNKSLNIGTILFLVGCIWLRKQNENEKN